MSSKKMLPGPGPPIDELRNCMGPRTHRAPRNPESPTTLVLDGFQMKSREKQRVTEID